MSKMFIFLIAVNLLWLLFVNFRDENVVQLFTYFSDYDSIVLVMEYASEGSLLDALKCIRFKKNKKDEQEYTEEGYVMFKNLINWWIEHVLFLGSWKWCVTLG